MRLVSVLCANYLAGLLILTLFPSPFHSLSPAEAVRAQLACGVHQHGQQRVPLGSRRGGQELRRQQAVHPGHPQGV